MKNVFVYTYGRVGSTCVFNSISEHCNASHFHNLPDGMEIDKQKVLLISGVRDPIARGISAYFTWIAKKGSRNFKSQYAGYGKYYVSESQEEILKMSGSQLVDKFLSVLLEEDVWDRSECWFDLNLKKHFGIDVYSEAFDKKENNWVVEQSGWRLLMYKQEYMSGLPKAIEKFLGLDGVVLPIPGSNGQWYKDAKDRFLKKLTFSPSDLDKIYENPKVGYFYSDEEINSFRKKWLNFGH